MEIIGRDGTAQLTAEIVSAYVARNKIESDQLTKLIEVVHLALARAPGAAAEPKVEALVPAVPVKKSVTRDYIVCLEDGGKFKSLKRHLTKLGMTSDEYRAKWSLPRDYPMVAPSYAEKRSTLAKKSGLGLKKLKSPAPKSPAKKAAAGSSRKKRPATRAAKKSAAA
jgi:predicted transcriptional regulator